MRGREEEKKRKAKGERTGEKECGNIKKQSKKAWAKRRPYLEKKIFGIFGVINTIKMTNGKSVR